jgi:hypothetical protein
LEPMNKPGKFEYFFKKLFFFLIICFFRLDLAQPYRLGWTQ